MREPYWTVKTDEMAFGTLIVFGILALPFIAPFSLGYYLGEQLSNVNGVRYVLGGLFALGWFYILYMVREKYGVAGLVKILIAEALLIDAVLAFIRNEQMISIQKIQEFHAWFTQKIN